MISYQIIEHGRPLQKVMHETPKPTGTEVLVKITRSGVCHSDVHIWDGYFDWGGGKRFYVKERGCIPPFTLGVEPLRVELGVGIAKGRVFSGSVGTGKLHEFTALGRTVNLASRLCDLASRGEVRCCNFTYLDIRDYARFQRSEEVQMKGLDKTIRTYSIQGVSDHAITRPVKPGTRPLSALDQINAEDFATRVIRRLPEDVRRTRIMTATPAEFEVDS
jgi:hypothetical protein